MQQRQTDRPTGTDGGITDVRMLAFVETRTDGDGTNSPNRYGHGGLSLRYKKINYNCQIGGL